jgi:hypothetical protein
MEILNFQKIARIISITWVNKLFMLNNKMCIIILFIIIGGIFSKKVRTDSKIYFKFIRLLIKIGSRWLIVDHFFVIDD